MHPSATARLPLHPGDLVRSGVLVLVLWGLAKVMLLSEHYRLETSGWVLFIVVEAALLFSGVRVVLLEAWPRGAQGTRLARTRDVGALAELMIAGTGGFLLWMGLAGVILVGAEEVWGGRPGVRPISPLEAVNAGLLGLAGFFMVLWRPMFVIDLSAGVVRRYPFGRALGWSRSMPASGLRVFSEGYFITNTRHRLGDMIRGQIDGRTFELELVEQGAGPEVVQARVRWWAEALRAAPSGPTRQQ